MFVWYFKEENTLRFWRLCGRIEKTRRKETAVTLQQLRYVTAVAGTGTISHAVQQFYISQPSLTNAIRELEQEVGLALSKTASSVVSRTLLDARGQMSAKSMHPPAYGQRKCQKKKGVQEKMKHLHKGGWCHPHSTRRLAFCRGCRIRQNTTPAKGALPGRLSPSTAALKTHRPRLRSAAMKAPVGLLSGSAVCDSRWRGVAPTSATPTRSLRKCRRIEEVKSQWSTTFSRIENLWPRDGSCPLPLRSKPFLGNCFRIVKAQKISRGCAAHVCGSPFAPNEVPTPVLQRR